MLPLARRVSNIQAFPRMQAPSPRRPSRASSALLTQHTWLHFAFYSRERNLIRSPIIGKVFTWKAKRLGISRIESP